MSEVSNQKRVRTNLKHMTEEQRLAHVRAKYLQYTKIWKARHPEYFAQRIQCECGCSYTRNNKSTHMKSAKHAQIIEILQRAHAQHP